MNQFLIDFIIIRWFQEVLEEVNFQHWNSHQLSWLLQIWKQDSRNSCFALDMVLQLLPHANLALSHCASQSCLFSFIGRPSYAWNGKSETNMNIHVSMKHWRYKYSPLRHILIHHEGWLMRCKREQESTACYTYTPCDGTFTVLNISCDLYIIQSGEKAYNIEQFKDSLKLCLLEWFSLFYRWDLKFYLNCCLLLKLNVCNQIVLVLVTGIISWL